MVEDSTQPYRIGVRQGIIERRIFNVINSQIRGDQEPLVNPSHLNYENAEVIPLPDQMMIALGDIELHPEHWIQALLGSSIAKNSPELFCLNLLVPTRENRGSLLRRILADIGKSQADQLLSESLNLCSINPLGFWREVKHAWNSHIADSNERETVQPPFVSHLLSQCPTSS